jgi:hypothetical protein
MPYVACYGNVEYAKSNSNSHLRVNDINSTRPYLKKVMIRRDICQIPIDNLIEIKQLLKKDFEDFDFKNIPDPSLKDREQCVDIPIDSNIEVREDMTVVFPEGFQTLDGLKNTIADISKNNSSIFNLYSAETENERDYADDNLMRAFPKQFPHGRGGPDEIQMSTNKQILKLSLDKYLEHINQLSDPRFHSQMLCLVSYSIIQRQNMIQNAAHRVRSSADLPARISKLIDAEIKMQVRGKKWNL